MLRRRGWLLVQDSFLAAIVALAGLGELFVPFDSVQGHGSVAASAVAIVVASAFLALRRIVPLALIGVPLTWVAVGVISGGVVFVLFFGQLVPLYLALYSAARHAPRGDAIAVVATIAGTVVLADLTQSALQGPSELIFHWAVYLAVLGVGLGLRTSERRAVTAALRAAAAEADAREAALRAVAQERARIARELHDILGHSVSVMIVQAGAAAQAVDDDPAFARRALEAIRTTGTQSLDEVRRVVALLRADDTGTAPQPDLAAVPALIDQARADGLIVAYTESGDGAALSPGHQLCVYRIVQEALTNVRKHAPTASVIVAVTHAAAATEVVVIDEHRGASPDVAARREGQDPGHGIVGMRERVAMYGGIIEAGPAAGGWRVSATIPVGAMATASRIELTS